ncbi:MAG TPA: GxxExxY protein [Vicinamibacterales bacterium]|nr:GxxExxY protein [Vicinamibacterales bacterium]
MNKEQLNSLTDSIIAAALEVHRELGPGLLEQAYEVCLTHELLSWGFNVERQKALPLTYKRHALDFVGYRLDLLVEGAVVVEVKSIEKLERVHSAQLLSYLKFADCRVGLLFNFNVSWLTSNGLKRVVNGFPE